MLLRSLCAVCLAILLGWSVGIQAGEAPFSEPVEEGSPVLAGEPSPKRGPAEQQHLANQLKALQVPFISGDQQGTGQGIKFVAKTLAGSVLVSDEGVIYQLKRGSHPNPATVAIKESWIRPKSSQASGLKPSKARFSFFKGADQGKWKRNVQAFDEVEFGQVYDGVFVTLKAYNNNVEKIFSVAEGADPQRIAIRVEGIADLTVNQAGELELRNDHGTLKMTAPVAYQEVKGERKFVKAAYRRLSRNSYGFKVGGYDRSLPLIIDPTIASTFLGDVDSDLGYAIDSDNSSIFVTGWTNSAYFPITDDAYDPIQKGGSYDVFVSKLDLSLNLLASTFLGGAADDFGMGIAVADLDGDGTADAVYVAGSTKSNDFPIPVSDNGTTPAFDTRFNGVQDAFLCRFDINLTDLQLATYLGGSGSDQAYALKAAQVPSYDPVNPLLLYVTGPTQSQNFPVFTDSAYSVVPGGSNDVFVSAFDQNLKLHYSTLLGGSASDIPYALDVRAEKVFVAGSTLSTNFPTNPGAYRRLLVGKKADAFVSRFDYTLGVLEGSTLLGGSTDDTAYALAVDGNSTVPIKGVYVAGFTNSVNFPSLTHNSKGKKINGKEDVFVAWLTQNLVGKVQENSQYAATLLGGTLSDYAVAMKLDYANGRLVIAGNTKSSNFPILPKPASPARPYTAINGGIDGFVMIVDDNLTASNPIIESTFIGGAADDRPMGVVMTNTGYIYTVGTTKSTDYRPARTTTNAYSAKEDVFISAFDGSVAP